MAPATGLSATPGAIDRTTVMPASEGESNRCSTKRTRVSSTIWLAVRASRTPVASRGKVGITNRSRYVVRFDDGTTIKLRRLGRLGQDLVHRLEGHLGVLLECLGSQPGDQQPSGLDHLRRCPFWDGQPEPFSRLLEPPQEGVAGQDRGRGDCHVGLGSMHLDHRNAAETRIDQQAALDVPLVTKLIAENEFRLQPMTDQVL